MHAPVSLPQAQPPKRILVGVSGATGIVYAARLLEVLRTVGVETHLVISRPADRTRAYETDLSRSDMDALADQVHKIDDIGAPVASGSFRMDGMVIIPCSMKTLAEIATGTGSNLLARAADVTLKERRRLILVARETPLSLVHIRNMEAATLAGAIVFPPVTQFYTRPKSIDELIDHTVGRMLDLLGIEAPRGLFARWGETSSQETETTL